MTSSIICDPCHILGKQNQASQWCPYCDERLCEQCSLHHLSSKATTSHNLFVVKDMSKLLLSVTAVEVCRKHQHSHAEYFCTSRDEFCCRKCIADNHKTCKDVTIDLECQNTKSSLLEETKIEIKLLIEILESANTEIEKKSSEVEPKRKKIEHDIAYAKSKACNQLDDMETALVAKLDDKADEFKREAQNKSNKIRDILETSKEKLKQIEFVDKHGSDKQAFYLAYKVKTFFKEVETPLVEATTINAPIIEFTKPRSPISSPRLGITSKFEQTQQVLNNSPVKEKQATFTMKRNQSLTSFQLSSEFQTNIPGNYGPNVVGMIATEDEKLLLCNHWKKQEKGGVYVYDKNNALIQTIALPEPCDITLIKSKNQFAVSLSSEKSIQFICENTWNCLRKVELSYGCCIYGIAATKTDIYIGALADVIRLNINKMTNRMTINDSFCDRQEFDINRLCYVQATTEEVYVSSENKISTFDKSKEFQVPAYDCARKIAVDNQGYVYVAVCSKTHYIQRLTSDLKSDIKIKTDGGNISQGMWAICFNKDCSKLFCAKDRGNSIVIMSCS